MDDSRKDTAASSDQISKLFSIPTKFTSRYIWSHSRLREESQSIQWRFEEEMLSDAQSSLSYAFHCSMKEPASDTALYLSSPYHGGQSIVDAMVKHLALREGADVLVIDALELVSGKLGSLGDDGVNVETLYQNLPIKDAEMDPKVQDFFNCLINTAFEPGTHSSNSSSRRILYLRDFGMIASVAGPLILFLLHAMDDFRTKRLAEREGSTSGIVMILGHSRPLGYWDDGGKKSTTTKGFVNFTYTEKHVGVDPSHLSELRKGNVPTCQFPMVEQSTFWINTHSEIPFDYLASTFFARVLYEYRQSKKIHLWPETSDAEMNAEKKSPFRRDRLQVFRDSVIFFSVDTESMAFTEQQTAIAERAAEINFVFLKLMLAKQGIIINGEQDAEFTKIFNKMSDKELQYSLITPEAMKQIVLDLTILRSPFSTDIVSVDDLVKAIQKWLSRSQRMVQWAERDKQRCKGSDLDSTPLPGKGKSVIDKVQKSRDLSEHEKKLLSCIVDPDNIAGTRFSDICIEQRVIDNLKSIISLPLLHPQHFQTGILSREALSGALLYGPPGTGKTMVCRALACESDAQMLLVKPSDVYDMWVGESEKFAKSVFTLAQRLAPCVIFIDEVDAIFRARDSGRNVHREMLTEFLQAMDGLAAGSSNKDKGVVVVGATNRPHDLDQAILRRLPYRMMIDLPGKAQRKNILKGHLRGETLQGVDLDIIASNTEAYSGSDLKNLCVSAAMEALKDCVGGLDPSTSPKADHENLNGSEKDIKRVITQEHFDRAFVQVVASFSYEGNISLYEWHEEYGTYKTATCAIKKRKRETSEEMMDRIRPKMLRVDVGVM
ncbi:mitochondrial aaa [Moniliophthora roreri MCA 2997]|uniref:Mitochondrial aaa n=2 Tax=Moniliophthora roreri TaxID=221103 RepID=V2WW28_MONRO|nr:mitochondrial aaa [Moniliophthora roreri MCA 2997]KAI3605509.1 mitochondrial aaa [Moniliophthora roreri]